jgi:hypothetical protein
VSGESFLDEHRATLVPDGSKWLLTYPIARYEYGERTPERVEVRFPIVATSYYDALALVGVILRGHVAPRVQEFEVWTPPVLPTGRHVLLGRKAGQVASKILPTA